MATPREQLADLLRQARLAAGFSSHQALARRLNVSRPVITRAENPREAVPSHAVIRDWAQATGADLAQLIGYENRARSPRSWFAKWADDFEQRATMIRWFEPLLVPGLAETENYARAALSWKPFAADAEATLRDRLARQSVLDRAGFHVLILGSVLHREVGDASVMSEQIQHLLDVGERPSVSIQIVPDAPDIAGALGGAFAIATEGTSDVAAYSGSAVSGTVHTEPDLITRAVKLFGGLQADALPWKQTRDFLQEAGKRWQG
ncbi:MAG TPA: helix-turn-helix transcriptional regulator [Streptosporangiaceae bacterium]|jgi:transcriptional regulator with XRE-family HTH domain|nr:helix-turn-helix transcriptional regulator [Streptosporangiaceae bacterium]